MINERIVETARNMGIIDKLNNFERIVQLRQKPPAYLRNGVRENEMLILGDGDLNEYSGQPLIIIPINDFFKMMQSVDPDKLIFKKGKKK